MESIKFQIQEYKENAHLRILVIQLITKEKIKMLKAARESGTLHKGQQKYTTANFSLEVMEARKQ